MGAGADRRQCGLSGPDPRGFPSAERPGPDEKLPAARVPSGTATPGSRAVEQRAQHRPARTQAAVSAAEAGESVACAGGVARRPRLRGRSMEVIGVMVRRRSRRGRCLPDLTGLRERPSGAATWPRNLPPTSCCPAIRSHFSPACCSTSSSPWSGPSPDPRLLADRLGVDRLDPRAIAALDPDAFVALASGPPAVHRYPRAMAGRIQTLAQHVVDQYAGDTAAHLDHSGDRWRAAAPTPRPAGLRRAEVAHLRRAAGQAARGSPSRMARGSRRVRRGGLPPIGGRRGRQLDPRRGPGLQAAAEGGFEGLSRCRLGATA